MDETQQTQTTPPSSAKASEGKETNVMALISYIGPLCLIPFLTKDRDEFVKFHMKQGMVVFICELITWIAVLIAPILWFLGNLAGILWLIFSIIGIMNVIKGAKKELPVIGKYAGKIKI